MYIVGISGASGSIIGIRLAEELLRRGERVGGIISDTAVKIASYELTGDQGAYKSFTDILVQRGNCEGLFTEYSNSDLFAPPASGSFRVKGVIIAPCSMKTLSAAANGYSDTLITRSFDVALKESRRAVIIPRESPLNLIHLDNMRALKLAGADIVLPVPGFYAGNQSVDDVISFTIGKVFNLLEVEHDLFTPWGDK